MSAAMKNVTDDKFLSFCKTVYQHHSPSAAAVRNSQLNFLLSELQPQQLRAELPRLYKTYKALNQCEYEL